jgi:hypothetical protein
MSQEMRPIRAEATVLCRPAPGRRDAFVAEAVATGRTPGVYLDQSEVEALIAALRSAVAQEPAR